MPRRCLTASLLFCFLTALAIAQGTPGGKTPIITEFTPLSEQELQVGAIRLFDGFSTYGWQNGKIENGALYYSNANSENSPMWFFSPVEGGERVARIGGQVPPPPYQPPGSAVGTHATLALIAVPQDMKPLFDGKTLAGWTLRGKAEAVVEDGVIKLTNGSGSLESDGKYGDFILQLEYFTPVRPDGKGINSGVFFRCIPGETMNGYECQILNKPGEKDYASFIGTDTGGIFRRQVGRNVGPKDGEWNYITIAAKGTRMATWVNGIQVTDWNDEREPHKNPRNGCRTEAGTIQFQGHDPGTEILFRNIRIREL